MMQYKAFRLLLVFVIFLGAVCAVPVFLFIGACALIRWDWKTFDEHAAGVLEALTKAVIKDFE